MTTKEEKAIQDVHGLVAAIRKENADFRAAMTDLVAAMNKKVEVTYKPFTLEDDILKVARKSVSESIAAAFTGYNNPLGELTKSVVNQHSAHLRKIIEDSFTEVIAMDEFKQSIVNAFSHKVARTIISNNDGLFDKVCNDLRGDAVFKAKMSLAVSKVVEECLKEKKEKA